MSAQPTPQPEAERRVATRYQPAFGTVCRLNRPSADGEPTVGLVWNISQTGVSMLLADPPEKGARLEAELTTESGGSGLPVGLRVVHVREMPLGDYFLGAQFTRPLADDDLKPFLLPLPPPVPPVDPPKPEGETKA